MNVAAFEVRAQSPPLVERWYVLILVSLIYAVNIADRYVVSTGSRTHPLGSEAD